MKRRGVAEKAAAPFKGETYAGQTQCPPQRQAVTPAQTNAQPQTNSGRIGERIRTLRGSRGWSLERGHKDFGMAALRAITMALETTMADLFRGIV